MFISIARNLKFKMLATANENLNSIRQGHNSQLYTLLETRWKQFTSKSEVPVKYHRIIFRSNPYKIYHPSKNYFVTSNEVPK